MFKLSLALRSDFNLKVFFCTIKGESDQRASISHSVGLCPVQKDARQDAGWLSISGQPTEALDRGPRFPPSSQGGSAEQWTGVTDAGRSSAELNPSLGGPGALSVQGQMVPSSVMQAASKVFSALAVVSSPLISLNHCGTAHYQLHQAQRRARLAGKLLRQMAFFWGEAGTGRRTNFSELEGLFCASLFSFMETIQGEAWGVLERIWGLNFLRPHLHRARKSDLNFGLHFAAY